MRSFLLYFLNFLVTISVVTSSVVLWYFRWFLVLWYLTWHSSIGRVFGLRPPDYFAMLKLLCPVFGCFCVFRSLLALFSVPWIIGPWWMLVQLWKGVWLLVIILTILCFGDMCFVLFSVCAKRGSCFFVHSLKLPAVFLITINHLPLWDLDYSLATSDHMADAISWVSPSCHSRLQFPSAPDSLLLSNLYHSSTK